LERRVSVGGGQTCWDSGQQIKTLTISRINITAPKLRRDRRKDSLYYFGGSEAASFWTRGSIRSGSNIGSSGSERHAQRDTFIFV